MRREEHQGKHQERFIIETSAFPPVPFEPYLQPGLCCPAQRAAQPLVGLRSMRGRDAVSRVEVARSLRRILAAVQPPGL